MSRSKVYLDILERVFWTALQGFAAELLVTQSFDTQSLKVAGAAAGLAALKCVLATQIGDSSSAAALPGVKGNSPVGVGGYAGDEHPDEQDH